VIITLKLLDDDNYSDYVLDTYIKPLDINGIIEKKYIDSADHSLPRILLTNKNTLSDITIYDYSPVFYSFYEFAQIGDSIIKSPGDNVFIVIRTNKSYRFQISTNDQDIKTKN
jgi:hypothetical protein